MSNKSTFNTLNTLNLRTKSNQGRRYIPWNTLWAELKKVEPSATFEFHCNDDGVPYFNSKAGIFVKVSVTVGELTHTMTRPVYDYYMKSMTEDGYEYITKKGTKQVAPAKADDVNDAQMRCFAKAIAMHGLGLFVFEDKQYADAELLDSSQISEISNLIAKHNLMLSELNCNFGINKLSELYAINYESALQWIKENATNS
jgi:desulfoferrodoxin (superoxide reductase-like protein)